MVTMNTTDRLATYYQDVQRKGMLHTPASARQWSRAVLQGLGFHLDGRTKKELARALPAELAEPLTRDYRLFRFRRPHTTQREFYRRVALKGGNTDPNFTRFPVTAVFHSIKKLISPELSQQVAQSLGHDLRQLWEEA